MTIRHPMDAYWCSLAATPGSKSDLCRVVGWSSTETLIQSTIPVEQQQPTGLDSLPHGRGHWHQDRALRRATVDGIASRAVVPGVENAIGADDSVQQVFDPLHSAASQPFNGQGGKLWRQAKGRDRFTEGNQVIAQLAQFVPAELVCARGAGFVLERAAQMEQRNGRWVGKDLDDPAGVSLATDGWVVAKAQCLQSPPDGLSSQSAVPVQVLPVGRIGSCMVAAENGGHLPVARASASLVGDRKGGINCDQAGGVSRQCFGDKVQNLIVTTERGRGSQHTTAC